MNLSEKEARAIGILVMSVGSVSSWSLHNVFKVPKKRADYIEENFDKLTESDIKYIRSFIPDAPRPTV